MHAAVPDSLIQNYAHLIPKLALPDPADRHVLAAAIRCRAEIIVTANLTDFPTNALAMHDVVARHPDEFLLGILDRSQAIVLAVLNDQSRALRAPALTVEDILVRLEGIGIAQFVTRVRTLRAGLDR
jgi:hypothetical protein